MRIARQRFLHLQDEHDRAAALEAGLPIEQKLLGNYPYERPADVVELEDRDEARCLIHRLHPRAQLLRSKARRTAA